jgi:cation transport regulator ChaB
MTNATLTPTAPKAPVSSREQTISAIFETQALVQDAVKRLIDRGVPAEDISVMGRNFESTTRVAGFVTKRDVILGGLKQGAIFGSLFGSVLSLLSGVGVLFIPFLGPIIAAGPIGAVLLGATSGALIGSAGGGLGSLLVTLGMPADKAAIYQTLVSAGEFLLMAEVSADRTGEYQLLIESASGKEIHMINQTLPRPCAGKCNTPDDLTPEIRAHLSPIAQESFIKAYNAALDEGNSIDAEYVAWEAIRQQFDEDKDGIWSNLKAE